MRRSIGLFLVVGVVLPLVVATNASAQGTTLQLTPQTVSPGQVVTATGGSFNNAAGANPVNIRLNHRDGPIILGGANLNTRGQLVDAQFPMPSVPPGIYLVLATQTYANGRHVAFTPGRTRIRVVAAAKGAGASGGAGPSGLLSTGVILALTLLAGGSILAAARLRTHNRPNLGN